MSRYIDADALLNSLPDDLPYKASVKRVLIQAPTANVAPIADTLREMQNRLTQAIGTYTKESYVYVHAWFKLIDQIAEEIIKGETLPSSLRESA